MGIRRRNILIDLWGRILSLQDEEVREDPQGNMEEIRTTTMWVCPTCNRPIANPSEDIRSRCTYCGQQLCSDCIHHCAICHRPVCPDCRFGFAEKGLSVCTDCLPELEKRLARADFLLDEKLRFEQRMRVYETLLRLMPLLGQDDESLIGFLERLQRLRLAGKLNELARQLSLESTNERRLLP